jgi:hypothetical protein
MASGAAAVKKIQEELEPGPISWFQYIPIREIVRWEEVGWVIVAPVNVHAVLGKWPLDSEPTFP